MPIVTNGLLRYWNAKDGVKTGNTLRNLAPGQAAENLTIAGGTYNAGGYIVLDGIDDTITLASAAALRRTGAWSAEFIHYITSDPSSYNELFGGAAYVDYSPGSMYFETYPNAGSEYVYETLYDADFGAVGKILHWIVTYDGNNLTGYMNGRQAFTGAIGAAQAFAGTAEEYMQFNSEIYSTPFPSRWHAFRYYDRALSAAEAATNFSNGTEIGLSTPEVKIGEYRVSAAGVVTTIPIYSITGHENEPYRQQTADGKGYIPLVLPTDPLASRIRVKVAAGIRAYRK